MTRLPPPPPEPPAISDTTGLAPQFRAKLLNVLLAVADKGYRPVLRETLRTTERAAWLYGFGREYDDGRGIVTNAPNALKTWHHYALAADVGDRRYESGNEPACFWDALRDAAHAEGLTWGGDWQMRDLPHVQWYCDGMHVSPSDHAAAVLASDGVEAVWRELHASP